MQNFRQNLAHYRHSINVRHDDNDYDDMMIVMVTLIVITTTLLWRHPRIWGSHLYVRDTNLAYVILEKGFYIRFYLLTYSVYSEDWEKYKRYQKKSRNETWICPCMSHKANNYLTKNIWVHSNMNIKLPKILRKKDSKYWILHILKDVVTREMQLFEWNTSSQKMMSGD